MTSGLDDLRMREGGQLEDFSGRWDVGTGMWQVGMGKWEVEVLVGAADSH